MDDVELIIPDQISDEFLIYRRKSAEERENEKNQENVNKTKIMYIRRLIQKVRKQRVLYDINLKAFSNTKAKEKAWLQIAKELGREVDECKNSWVKLRYLYQKHVRVLRKFLQSGNKDRKRRPIMPLESDLLFLWKFISDMSYIPKRQSQKQATTVIDCEDDDVVLVDDANPVIVIDLDDNEIPTKKNKCSMSQTKDSKVQITPEVRGFIDALKEYPELYDVDNRYFSDYRRKGIIWNALANELKDKATKLMKLWIYLLVRYEWEISNVTKPETETELAKLLDFLKTYLQKNPKTVYKQSLYLKAQWQEPIDHFKNIFQLLVVIRKYPNIINLTDEYLLSAKKDDYTTAWLDISKTRGVTPGQCEVTWLIMRNFYWELMNMRKHTYQLQDKWYFEGIITELFLHAKPKDQQNPAETEVKIISDIHANSFAKSTPIPIDLEENINATFIYNKPENSLCKTNAENANTMLPKITSICKTKAENSNAMLPKITSAKSLHVSAQNSFASLEKRGGGPYSSVSTLPATIKPANRPIDITVVPPSTTHSTLNLLPTINKNMQSQLNRPTIQPLNRKTTKLREILPKTVTTISLPLPPLTPITSSALTISAPSVMPPLHVVSTRVQLPSLPTTTPSTLQSSLPSISAQSPATYSPASSSLKVPVSSSPITHLNSATIPPNNPLLPTVSSSTTVRMLPVESASQVVLPSGTLITNTPSVALAINTPAIISEPNSTRSVPAPQQSLPFNFAKPAPISELPAVAKQLASPPIPEPLPAINSSAPLPKITGALSLLNPNEIMIELVATLSGNQLLVHGPPLSAKYSLSMETTAKFIREVMAIPRLHNKNIQPSATNLYWQYLSKKFTLPIHICKAIWNFLADNFTHFNQIAPIDELMKPFKTLFKVWKEGTVLFKNFETLAAERGWLKYQNELPLLISEISNHQEVFEIIANKQRPLPTYISLAFSHIPDLLDICIVFKNVFEAYMTDLERGVENKWPQTWWRVLMKLKFLHENRYKNTEPFFYIVRNKINEEIVRCAQNESMTKEETQVESATNMGPPASSANITQPQYKLSKKANVAPKSVKKSVDYNSIDPYKLMLCIRKHSNIYTKCHDWQKLAAWKTIAKEMESTVKDCRIVFTRLVKDYRSFVHRDPNGLCKINRKYFKPLKEIHQSLELSKTISSNTLPETNIPANDNSPIDESDENFTPDGFIGDVKMENEKPSLVMKNWVQAIGDITNSSQGNNSIDGVLLSLFEKYRKLCT